MVSASDPDQALVCMRCGAALDAGASERQEPLTCAQCGAVHAHEQAPTAADQRAHAIGDPVLAEWGGRWWRAEILAPSTEQPERWRVRYLGWSDDHARELGHDRLRDIAGGAPLRRWKLILAFVGVGLLGAVAVLLANKGQLVGTEATRPVAADTALRPGQSVEVEREGVWTPAQILTVNEDGSVNVRYIDSGLEAGTPGDERVTREQLRLP